MTMLNKLFNRLGFGPKAPTPPLEKPPTSAPPILVVTDDTFADLVLASDQLVVVDFWAEWCQPCEIMSAYVGFLAKEFAGQLTVAAMDVDENPMTSPQYDIMGLPTLILFVGGAEVDRIVGVESYEIIRDRVASWLVEKQ